MRKAIILFFTVLLLGCQSNIDGPEEYIERFDDYEYSLFKNSLVFLRSSDITTGESTIVVTKPYEKGMCERPIIIFYSHRWSKVKEIKNRVDDTCNINNEIATKLAMEFMKHKANSIRVDSSANVYVDFAKFHIIKVVSPSTLQTIANEFRGVRPDEYTHLSGDWYVKYKEE